MTMGKIWSKIKFNEYDLWKRNAKTEVCLCYHDDIYFTTVQLGSLSLVASPIFDND